MRVGNHCQRSFGTVSESQRGVSEGCISCESFILHNGTEMGGEMVRHLEALEGFLHDQFVPSGESAARDCRGSTCAGGKPKHLVG